MKLIYLTSKIYPSRTANSIQTRYMAKSFAEVLDDDFLFVLSKNNEPGLFDGVQTVETGYAKRRLRSLYYLFWFPAFLASHRGMKRGDMVVYCRDFYLALTAIVFKKIFGYKIAFEYHDPPFGRWRDRFITRFCDYLLPTTRAMQTYLIGRGSVADGKFHIAPNGVDISEFPTNFTQQEARDRVGLPEGRKIVLYSGHLYPKKGAYTVLEAARKLRDVLFVFIGGTEKDIKSFREQAGGLENVHIAGYKNRSEVPCWLKSADILLAPQSAKDNDAKQWACPLKNFEYMASGVPLIASDVPPIREVLNERNCFLAQPDDSHDLARKITDVFSNYAKAKCVAEQARRDAQEYTWQKRTRRILEFITSQSVYVQY